jgi:hypothetical protein
MKNTHTKFNCLMALAGLIAFAAPLSVNATSIPEITIKDLTGPNTWTILDNIGPTDWNAAVGGILFFNQTYASWTVSATFDPNAGTAVAPVINITASELSPHAGGGLEIEFSSMGFGPTNGIFKTSIGGTVGLGGSVTYNTYASTDDLLYGTNTPLTSYAFNAITGTSFQHDAFHPVALGAPYSVTQVIDYTNVSGTGDPVHSNGFVAKMWVENVPEGSATLGLLGIALLALGFIKRRRN